MRQNWERYEWLKLVAEALLCVILMATAALGYLGQWSSIHEKTLLHGALLLLAFGGLAVFLLIVRLQLRRHGGLETFDQYREHDSDRPLFKMLHEEYLYVGQSFHSNAGDLLDYLEGMPRGSRIRLILADLRDQETIASLWAIAPDESLRTMTERLARQQMEVASQLADTSNLQIGLYRRGMPFWMHRFDSDRIVFGLLQSKKAGRRAAAVELRPVEKQYNLYNYFEQIGEIMWMQSERMTPRELENVASRVITDLSLTPTLSIAFTGAHSVANSHQDG